MRTNRVVDVLRVDYVRRSPLAIGFSIGLLLGVSIVPAEPVQAAPSSNCHTTDADAGKWNTQGKETGQTGSQTGIKADMAFGNANGDCVRVSSLGVINGSGQVEWGWVLGYHPKGPNVYTGPGACSDADYFTSPEAFMVWIPTGGAYHCENLFGNSNGINHTMAIKNSNSNQIFNVFKDGTSVGSMNVNFQQGMVGTNGERHNKRIDSAYSHFMQLQKLVSGQSTWFDFCCAAFWSSNDPNYHYQQNSNTNTEVVHN